MYGTSAGRAFAINPAEGKPLWTFFVEAAREAIDAAKEDAAAEAPCEPVEFYDSRTDAA